MNGVQKHPAEGVINIALWRKRGVFGRNLSSFCTEGFFLLILRMTKKWRRGFSGVKTNLTNGEVRLFA